ncbi:hypothetical protein AFAE65S_04082 [Alcaligenes phenolicus]
MPDISLLFYPRLLHACRKISYMDHLVDRTFI